VLESGEAAVSPEAKPSEMTEVHGRLRLLSQEQDWANSENARVHGGWEEE